LSLSLPLTTLIPKINGSLLMQAITYKTHGKMALPFCYLILSSYIYFLY